MLLRVLILGLGFFAASASASPLPDYPFVFATGTAKSDLPPDTVRFHLLVSADNSDAKLATAAMETTFKSVLTILAEASIGETDIDASVVDKSPRSHWDQIKSESVPDGYDVSRRVTVVVREIEKYPQMVRAILQLPGTEQFRAEFDRKDRSKVEADLLGLAASDAKAQAERMATQFGRKLGPVHAIAQIPFSSLAEEFGFSYSHPTFGYSPMAGKINVLSANSPIERLLTPATITISESVNVVYELQAPQ